MDSNKKEQKLWDKFQRIDSHQTFLYLYLLHKPDYAYNIAKTLKELKDKRLIKLYKLKTLTRPNVVSSVLHEMKRDGLIYISTKKKLKGRPRKRHDINIDVFSLLLHSHFPDADSWYDYVIINLIKRFRELVPENNNVNTSQWLLELDKIGTYNYITLLCYIYDQIVKDLGFAYLWQQKATKEYDQKTKEKHIIQRNYWINKIKTNTDQEFKKEKINQTFEKLIEIKKIKTTNAGGTLPEYTQLEFQREMIKDEIYKNLEKIISNIRETLLEIIALSKSDTKAYL